MKNTFLRSPRKNALQAILSQLLILALFFWSESAFALATTATYSGAITESTSAFSALTPAGTQMNGSVFLDTDELEQGLVTEQGLLDIGINIGGICLTFDGTGCTGSVSLIVTSIDSAAITGTGGVLGGSFSVTTFSSTFQSEVSVTFNLTDGTVNFESSLLGSMIGNGLLQASCAEPTCIDTDDDAIENGLDNCILVSNQEQTDSDQDGFGNACDPDLDNNGIVNFADLVLWTPFFSTTSSGSADFNGDGIVNFSDFILFQNYFLLPPGPSGLVQ